MQPLLHKCSLAIGAIALALPLAGCSPKESKDSADNRAGRSSPSGGTEQRTLAIGLSSFGAAEAWVPWLEGREASLVFNAIYESLVTLDHMTAAIVPQIAERWEVDATGKTWTFHLRKGVSFHDGRGEVTSADVKFSFEQFISDRAINSNKPLLRALVESVEAAEPYVIVFNLRQPNVTFAGRLVQNFGIVSKAYFEAVGDQEAVRKPIGTGPYKMIEHKRQQFVEMEAVESHWRHTARFKRLVLRRLPDQSSRLAMLRSGEIDVTEIPFKLKREAEAAGLKILKINGAAIYHIHLGGQFSPTRATFDPNVPWVGNPDEPQSQVRALLVRQALNLAIDRKAIIDAVFEGEAKPIVVPFFLPGSEFVPKDLKEIPYDPQQARRLLAQAGYAQGFSREIEMILMPWPGRAEMVDVSEAVAGYWEKNLGLKVKRLPMEFAAFIPNIGLPRKFAWITWAHGFIPSPVAEPIMAMDSWLTSKTRFGSVAERPDIDALSDKVHGSIEFTDRLKHYRDMAELFYNQSLAVPIASAPTLYAYDPKKLDSWQLTPGDSYLGGYERATPP